MNRNLTLTLDEGLLLSARKVALEQGTSVNAMVRDYLTDLTQHSARRMESRAVIQEFLDDDLTRLTGITWTRDELHSRQV